MKEIVFSPADLDVSPKKSFVLKFPDETLTLMFSEEGFFAESIVKSTRKTFKGGVKDSEGEFKKLIEELTKKLDKIIQVK
jgi:hypothetical protein